MPQWAGEKAHCYTRFTMENEEFELDEDPIIFGDEEEDDWFEEDTADDADSYDDEEE